jgi:hypothetical protein
MHLMVSQAGKASAEAGIMEIATSTYTAMQCAYDYDFDYGYDYHCDRRLASGLVKHALGL